MGDPPQRTYAQVFDLVIWEWLRDHVARKPLAALTDWDLEQVANELGLRLYELKEIRSGKVVPDPEQTARYCACLGADPAWRQKLFAVLGAADPGTPAPP